MVSYERGAITPLTLQRLIRMSQFRKNINLNLLRQRAREITNAIATLRRRSNRPKEEFVIDDDAVDASKYTLLTAIEAAISICNHLAARMLNKSPDTYAECFTILASGGLITNELADRLAAMAGFRNLLVHVYDQIDGGRVWEILRSDLRDLEEYVDAVCNVVGQGES